MKDLEDSVYQVYLNDLTADAPILQVLRSSISVLWWDVYGILERLLMFTSSAVVSLIVIFV